MKKPLKRISAIAVAILMFLSLSASAFATSTHSQEATASNATATSTANIVVSTGNNGDILSAYKVVEANFNPTTNNLTYSFTQNFKNFQQSATGEAYKNLTPTTYCDYTTDSDELKTILGLFTAYVKENSNLEANYTSNTISKGKATFSDVAMGQYIIVGSGNTTGAYIYQTVSAEIIPFINETTNKYQLYSSYDVTLKTSQPTGQKNMAGTTKDGSYDTATIGDTITYTLLGSVPTYPAGSTNTTYYMNDTLSNGLTLNDTSIVVKGIISPNNSPQETTLAKGTDYNITINGQNIYIDFVYENIKAFDEITVTYEAILNENAKIGTATGNPNSYKLIWSNAPYNGNGGTHPTGNGYGSATDEEIVYTYALIVNKYKENAETNKLANATFEIYNNSECTGNPIGTITTDTNGYASYEGLKSDTYYLKETIAPTGYTLLATPIEIELANSKVTYTAATTKDIEYTTNNSEAIIKTQAINSNGQKLYLTSHNGITIEATGNSPAYVKDITTNVISYVNGDSAGNGYIVTNVANTFGATLPTTGGIGTTIFSIIGIVLMLGAGILLITKKRMANRG